MSRPQRNTVERQMALEDRAENQRNRLPGRVWRAEEDRRTKQIKLVPSDGPVPWPVERPAWMNRRTGEPHEHRRQRMRNRLNDSWPPSPVADFVMTRSGPISAVEVVEVFGLAGLHRMRLYA